MIGKEVKIMYMLDHPNVVKLYTHFENKSSVFLVMELTPGVIIYSNFIFNSFLKGEVYE